MLFNLSRSMALFAFITANFATSAIAQNIPRYCQSDIATYCASVTPGGGRIAACLYAHTDRVSDACHAATTPTDTMLESLFDTVASTYEMCAADIQKHCVGASVGDGGVLICLDQNAPDIDADCRTAVRRFDNAMQ